MGILSFIQRYKWFLLLYFAGLYYVGYVKQYYISFIIYALVLAFIIYMDIKKRIDLELGFIVLYRTKFGIRFIERFSTKHRELVKLFGYIGIGVGFLGMLSIVLLLPINAIIASMQPEVSSGA